MKYITTIITFIFLATAFSTPVLSASQDECAIWLCLPGGFPSGCGGAKSAMKSRIKHHKSPLPNFSSCAVESSNMSYKQGQVTYIPPKSCGPFGTGTGSGFPYGGNGGIFGGCVPSSGGWVKNGKCPSLACQTKRYIDVFVDGQQAGTSYYY